jgi:hypothetical protein
MYIDMVVIFSTVKEAEIALYLFLVLKFSVYENKNERGNFV